jgi:hypothetical protein
VPARATVRLPVDCNNRCIFCSQDGLGPPGVSVASVRDQLDAARARADEVTFVGGEPMLDAAIADHASAARAMGFSRIGIQTNGRALADGRLAPSLAAAGVTDLHLSIHGAEAAVHDYHTGIEGSFDQALGALGAARAAGVAVVVATVLTRSNYRSLAPLPKLLASRGAAGWLIAVPVVAGAARGGFDRVVPRLGLALPFALSALDAAEALGLEARVSGAPRCMLGPYARWRLVEPPRAFAEACDGCPARDGCVGLDGAYLARFGGDEVQSARARMPAGPTDAPRDTPLGRAFVGAGELAPAPVAPTLSEKRKVSLPLADKARPARGEVTPVSPRQSGEALRAILPGLFEQADGPKGS